MRRLVETVGVAMLLAASIFAFSPINGSLTHPQESKAYCGGWGVERVNTASTQFWDVYLGRYNWLNVSVTTYSDGCATTNKYYESQEWFSYSTNFSDMTPYIRVWVCGTWKETTHGTQSSWWFSQTYYYGTCGRQADNSGTTVYLPYNGQ